MSLAAYALLGDVHDIPLTLIQETFPKATARQLQSAQRTLAKVLAKFPSLKGRVTYRATPPTVKSKLRTPLDVGLVIVRSSND